MGRKYIRISFLVLSFFFLQIHVFLFSSQDFQKGEIFEKVFCVDKPEQSYALFLPSAYTPEKTWPILYAFDPGARGSVPLEHFRDAAEKYGYIVVGSNNSRNGPWSVVFRAAEAVWNDTNARFSVDPRRVYATGFSGGSRAAALFPKIVNHPVTGIIGIGAGLPTELKPAQVKPAAYLGIVGLGDFNYNPMTKLDEDFDSLDVTHRLLIYEGEHAWAPHDICTRAIEWLEVLAMKQDLRPLDKALIDEIYSKELEKARMLEENGRVYFAVSDYEAIASLFKDWKDVQTITEKVSLLQQSSEYRKFLDDENERREREDFYRTNFIHTFARINNSPETIMNLAELYSELNILPLLDKAKNKKNIDERHLASRLLAELTLHAAEEGGKNYENKDYGTAIIFHEIAAKASEYNPSRLRYIHYELACFYALNSQKKKALKNLKLAVENGFDRVEIMEKDEDLASIRNSAEFQKIMEDLKNKKENKKAISPDWHSSGYSK
jgi:dienelactone hydrolase